METPETRDNAAALRAVVAKDAEHPDLWENLRAAAQDDAWAAGGREPEFDGEGACDGLSNVIQ